MTMSRLNRRVCASNPLYDEYGLVTRGARRRHNGAPAEFRVPHRAKTTQEFQHVPTPLTSA